MPRKPKPEHPELPFDAPAPVAGEGRAEPGSVTGSPTRKIGRPRKWESEAERKRAYRERLAADLAEPERLRRELRNAKRQSAEKARRLAQAERDLARAEAEIGRRSKRESELESTVKRLEARVDDWRSRANALARNLEAERVKVVRLTSSSPSGPRPTSRTNAQPSRPLKRRSRKGRKR